MNYEDFSERSKNVIDHVRKFCSESKNYKIVNCDCPYTSCSDMFVVSSTVEEHGFTMTMFDFIMAFCAIQNIPVIEAESIFDFLNQKNFWKE